MTQQTRIIIYCRLAYLNCWKPKKSFGKESYSLVALVSKEDHRTIDQIRSTIEDLKQKAMDKWGGKVSTIRSPLHDGDVDKAELPIFHNCYYLNARCKDAPQIVDQNVRPITDPSKIYSGCYANISLIFYPYNYGGTKGIGIWLGNIQLVRDGKRIVSRILAEDEFQPLSGNDMFNEFQPI